jgi:hypothetical protein
MASRVGRPLYKSRKLVKGVGILDVNFSHSKDVAIRHVYRVWMDMLERCYKNEGSTKHKSYRGCYVCDAWKRFSNFLSWWKENYVDGYAVDKDLVCKGNKCYCPEYCSFVPQRINNILGSHKANRGEYPIGVSLTHKGRFAALLKRADKHVSLGVYDTQEEAFMAYKSAKEQYIKEVADEYYSKELITKRVYDALYRWKIEITD